MKKSLVFIIAVILLMTGCSSDNRVLHCTSNYEAKDMKTNLDYKVTFKNDEILYLEAIESVEAEEGTLEELKKVKESHHVSLKDIKYYKGSVEIKDGQLISKEEIDYTKIDTKELFSKDKNYQKYFVGGKPSLNEFKKIYEQVGITCKED